MLNLTAKQVSTLHNSIFFKLGCSNENEWKVLMDFDGNTFEFISDAIYFVRVHLKGETVQLSSLSQALQNNSQWDNY